MRSPGRIAAVALLVVLGAAFGVGAFTFTYAKGYSYLSDDPAVCANCHIMKDQFDGWIKSSHQRVAVCNDCHTPHGSLLAKYSTKALNGFWHSYGFTTGRFPEPIRIKPRNMEITEAACRYCHDDLTLAIEGSHGASSQTACSHCHRRVGHL
jgi:cytochrome c nitrite reductase small subunit